MRAADFVLKAPSLPCGGSRAHLPVVRRCAKPLGGWIGHVVHVRILVKALIPELALEELQTENAEDEKHEHQEIRDIHEKRKGREESADELAHALNALDGLEDLGEIVGRIG